MGSRVERTATLAPEPYQLTSPGTALGTVLYMSPEQVLGKSLDARTDLFSFTVVIYEMASGAIPFKGDSTGAIFDEIVHKEPDDPLRLNPALPAELAQVIHKGMEKDRELRYQSAAELRADLKRLKRDISSGRVGSGQWRATKYRRFSVGSDLAFVFKSKSTRQANPMETYFDHRDRSVDRLSVPGRIQSARHADHRAHGQRQSGTGRDFAGRQLCRLCVG